MNILDKISKVIKKNPCAGKEECEENNLNHAKRTNPKAVCTQSLNKHSSKSVPAKYEQKYLDYYSLSTDRLPELVPTGTEIGCLKEEFCSGMLTKDTKVFAGSFDHPAAARAVKVLTPDDMLLSCGTSWVGFQPIPADTQVATGELFDPFQSSSGGYAAKMFSLAAVGIEIENFIQTHYGNSPDAYDRFNADPEALPLMQSIVDKAAEKILACSPKRIVMTGGPSEGEAWRRLLLKKLPALEFSSMQSFAGAVGGAMIAQGAVK